MFAALDDDAELLQRFTTDFGAPGALFALGGSMGGVVTLKMLDDPRFNLSGVYALCAPADVYGAWDSAFDLRLAYDAVCNEVTGGKLPKGDDPYPWALNLDQIPNNLSDPENAPAVLQTLLPVTICTGLGLNESIRFGAQKDRLATLMKYAQTDDEHFFTTQLAYAIFGLAEIVRTPDKLGGRSAFDSRYLDRGSYAGSTAAIDARIPALAPDLFARQYFAEKSLPARIRNPYGPTQVPVVSLYTSKDELVRTYHAQSILGARTLKARIDEPAPTHCGFTEAEVVGGWQALTQVAAGAPVPPTPAGQAQALLALCQQAVGAGAAGPCRIDPNATPQAPQGTPRRRQADSANVASNTSGLFYDPSRSGEGTLLEILPDNNALAAWFTFPAQGDPGEQLWVIGSGPWAGNGAHITPLIAGRGTQFGAGFDPAAITRLPWGSMTIAFDGSANGSVTRQNGRMRYQGPASYGNGEVAFDQLATMLRPDNIEFSPPLPTEQRFLGTFWNPARSGEGVMLTQDQYTFQPGFPAPAPRVYALWFTYDLVGNPMWLFGDVTGKDGQYQVSFLRPIGTHFGAAFNPAGIVRQPWGGGTISYVDCNHLTLNYSATEPGFGSGTLTLERLTAPIGTAGCGGN